MERIAAGLLVVALTITGCQSSDVRPDAGQADRAAAYGAAAGNVRPGQVTARLEQMLWDQRAPAYIRSDLWHLVRGSYDRRQYQPYWVGAGMPERAAALVAAVCSAEGEGLRSSDYQIERIAAELGELRRFRSADALAEFDLLLTGALFAYGEDLLLGRLVPGTVAPEWKADVPQDAAERLLQRTLAGNGPLDSILGALRPRIAAYDTLVGMLRRLRAADSAGGWAEIPDDQLLRRGARGPAVDALRRRLAATGELSASDTAPGRVFDRPLAQAVARFQTRLGLTADGVAGRETIAALNVSAATRVAQIEANLERYRWIPEGLIDRYAMLDVGAERLTVFEGSAGKEMAATLDDTTRRSLPPMLADTIVTVLLHAGGGRTGPGSVLMRLAQHGSIDLKVERPLELAAAATGRPLAELRAAVDSEADTSAVLEAALPVYLIHPTVRREGGDLLFTPTVSSRDVSIAEALGPARPQPAERCENLALSAASAVLSAP